MRWGRDILAWLMGLWFITGLVRPAWAQLEHKLTPPTLNGTIKTIKVPDVEIAVTGKLIRVMAIGGETTGWAVDLDEPRQFGDARLTRITIDPAGRSIADFAQQRVQITGILERTTGIERQIYWFIVLKEIRRYPN